MTAITKSILQEAGFVSERHGNEWYLVKKTSVDEKKVYPVRMIDWCSWRYDSWIFSCYSFVLGRQPSGEPKYDFVEVDSLEELMDYWLYINEIGSEPKNYERPRHGVTI